MKLPTDLPADQRRRTRMVRDQLSDCTDERVLNAMAKIQRHAFVPMEISAHAYDDTALAIGSGQTISQPRVVAQMLAALHLGPGMRALDVGAGSGYVTALLAELVTSTGVVIALERQGTLIETTRSRLNTYAPAAKLLLGDGLLGCEAYTPYDAIHVACACTLLPEQLIAQLAIHGRLILPLGPHDGVQVLTLIVRTNQSSVEQSQLGEVVFVPGLPGIA